MSNNQNQMNSIKADNIDELSENMDVISPGKILLYAREKAGYTQTEIAEKLNFRLSLVKDIENDVYNTSLPETYNRGYLRCFAKFVNADIDDVLARYDRLSITKIDCAKMQSFSKITEKNTENNRLMWVSYLIIALLIASTVMWWLQDSPKSEDRIIANDMKTNIEQKGNDVAATENIDNVSESAVTSTMGNEAGFAILPKNNLSTDDTFVENADNDEITTQTNRTIDPPQVIEDEIVDNIGTAIITFSGDCWVNIFDATGERIAWGVKKSGYKMTISGKAPLNVTIGRPELANVKFNGQDIDMTIFNTGNIAKFTLPLNP